ncbi:MAG: sigma-70 family RNA polymerase sigma factor [Chitinophagaceae bacterium]
MRYSSANVGVNRSKSNNTNTNIPRLKYTPGNHAEFTLIFRLFFDQLCRFSNKMIKDWPAAEDMVVDVFIRLWTNKGEFTCTASIKSWLYKCTFNDCIRHINKNKRRANLVVDMVEYNNKESEIIKLEEWSAVRSLVSSLPARCKSIVRLSYFIGLNNQQIASIFHISHHTVKNQKARGIYLVKERMRGRKRGQHAA